MLLHFQTCFLIWHRETAFKGNKIWSWYTLAVRVSSLWLLPQLRFPTFQLSDWFVCVLCFHIILSVYTIALPSKRKYLLYFKLVKNQFFLGRMLSAWETAGQLHFHLLITARAKSPEAFNKSACLLDEAKGLSEEDFFFLSCIFLSGLWKPRIRDGYELEKCGSCRFVAKPQTEPQAELWGSFVNRFIVHDPAKPIDSSLFQLSLQKSPKKQLSD